MIKRELYMKQLRDFRDKPVIKVITGMRRSGKSAMLELLQEELLSAGVGKNQIVYINFESLRYEEYKEYHRLYNHIAEQSEKNGCRLYVLLDEIQEVEQWEKAVNSLRVDIDCDIYITGSNAKLLSGELATILAGRYVEIHVYPLTFKEYLDFAHNNNEEEKLTIEENFANFLRYGGLPGIHQMKWNDNLILQYLQDIYNSVLLKDVIQRNKIRDTELLNKIVLYIMDNIGNTFSAKKVADFLKAQGRRVSVETVYNYLDALENAFLLYRVPRYDIKGKKLLETMDKFYLSDMGLRHSVIGYREQDIGGVLENIIFLELRQRGYAVNIGKQGAAEVDFVADTFDDRKYFQIAYVLTVENMDREFGSLENIQDNYEKMVLSTDKLLNINRGGIRQRNIISYLCEQS